MRILDVRLLLAVSLLALTTGVSVYMSSATVNGERLKASSDDEGDPYGGCRTPHEFNLKLRERFYSFAARILLDRQTPKKLQLSEDPFEPTPKDANRYSVVLAHEAMKGMVGLHINGTSHVAKDPGARFLGLVGSMDGFYVPSERYATRPSFEYAKDTRRKLVFNPEMGGWCVIQTENGVLNLFKKHSIMGIAASSARHPSQISVPFCRVTSDGVTQECPSSSITIANKNYWPCDILVGGGRNHEMGGTYAYAGEEDMKPFYLNKRRNLTLSSLDSHYIFHNATYDDRGNMLRGRVVARNDKNTPFLSEWRVRDVDGHFRPDPDLQVVSATHIWEVNGILISGRIGFSNEINDIYVKRGENVFEGAKNNLVLHFSGKDEISKESKPYWRIVHPKTRKMLAKGYTAADVKPTHFENEGDQKVPLTWAILDVDGQLRKDAYVDARLADRVLCFDGRQWPPVLQPLTCVGVDRDHDKMQQAARSWVYEAIVLAEDESKKNHLRPSMRQMSVVHWRLRAALHDVSMKKKGQLDLMLPYTRGSLHFKRMIGCTKDHVLLLFDDQNSQTEVVLRLFTSMPLTIERFHEAASEMNRQRIIKHRLSGVQGFIPNVDGELESMHWYLGWPCLVERAVKSRTLKDLFLQVHKEEALLSDELQKHPEHTRAQSLALTKECFERILTTLRNVSNAISEASKRSIAERNGIHNYLTSAEILIPGIIADVSHFEACTNAIEQVQYFPRRIQDELRAFWTSVGYLAPLANITLELQGAYERLTTSRYLTCAEVHEASSVSIQATEQANVTASEKRQIPPFSVILARERWFESLAQNLAAR
mmetsp:Transcript_13466/g.26446  ORF Transcript_13466/g.26446 Transcript_13466/m.26446 type:complete len:825 (+) Transcript_13466:29-2503(+)